MNQTEVKLQDMLELENELHNLKEEYGYTEKPALWVRIGDKIVNKMGEPRAVNWKIYLLLALTLGWICGAHRFYSGHKLSAVLYLVFCWTGIPLAITILDIILLICNCVPDENGLIHV